MPSRMRALLALLVTALAGVLLAPAPAAAQSANEEWVREAYTELLGRTADDGGISFWVGRLAADGAVSRQKVALSMSFSPEGATREVDRAYADLLSRTPDAEGRAFWSDYLRSQPATTLRSQLLASDERFDNEGSATAWLDGVYLEILGRTADPAGRDFWLGEVDRGVARLTVVLSIYRSDEGLARRADAIHVDVLGRSATAAEAAIGRAVILSGGERALRSRLLASDEAYEQFVRIAALRRIAAALASVDA